MGANAARVLVMVAAAAVGSRAGDVAKVLPKLTGTGQALRFVTAEGVEVEVEAVKTATIAKSGITLTLAPGAAVASTIGNESGGVSPGPQPAAAAGDVTQRPSGFRKQTVQDAWDNAATGSQPGSKACPTCGKDADVAPGQEQRDWDVDHQPKWKDRDLTGKTRKEVLDEYNKDVRLRCKKCNRSDNQ